MVACLCTIGASAEPGQAIKQFPLDERTIYQLTIGRDVPTTLMFPSALTAIEGANVTTTADAAAPVMLSYTPGQNFLSVRALEAGAKGAINVVWRQRTFVIRFAESLEPLGSVTFYDAKLSGPNSTPQKRVSPEVVVGLLDRAKANQLIEQQYPDAVQQIEHVSPGSMSYYRDFRVTVEDGWAPGVAGSIVSIQRRENASATNLYLDPRTPSAIFTPCVFSRIIRDNYGSQPMGAE